MRTLACAVVLVLPGSAGTARADGRPWLAGDRDRDEGDGV
jgi:hypothetical protein